MHEDLTSPQRRKLLSETDLERRKLERQAKSGDVDAGERLKELEAKASPAGSDPDQKWRRWLKRRSDIHGRQKHALNKTNAENRQKHADDRKWFDDWLAAHRVKQSDYMKQLDDRIATRYKTKNQNATGRPPESKSDAGNIPRSLQSTKDKKWLDDTTAAQGAKDKKWLDDTTAAQRITTDNTPRNLRPTAKPKTKPLSDTDIDKALQTARGAIEWQKAGGKGNIQDYWKNQESGATAKPKAKPFDDRKPQNYGVEPGERITAWSELPSDNKPKPAQQPSSPQRKRMQGDQARVAKMQAKDAKRKQGDQARLTKMQAKKRAKDAKREQARLAAQQASSPQKRSNIWQKMARFI